MESVGEGGSDLMSDQATTADKGTAFFKSSLFDLRPVFKFKPDYIPLANQLEHIT